MKTILTRVCGIVFLVGFAFAGFVMSRDLLRANASKHWPTVSGTVVSSSVEKRLDSGRNKATTYSGKVAYRYEVNGVAHTSSRVSYSEHGESGTGHAREIVERYPGGRTVTVYYRPESPDIAVLEPGAGLFAWIMPIALLIVSPGAPLLTLAAWLWRRSRPRPPATVNSRPAEGGPDEMTLAPCELERKIPGEPDDSGRRKIPQHTANAPRRRGGDHST